MTIQSSVKKKILTTPSETSKVENAATEMLRDMDQQMEKRADDGKANVVTDALSRKERVKPRRVRAMAMTIQYGVRGMILTAQRSVMDEAHASRYLVHPEADKTYYNLRDMYGQPRVEKDVATYVSNYNIEEWNSGVDKLILRWMIYLVVLADAAESVRDAIGFEYCLASSSGWTNIRCALFEALYGRKYRLPVLWAEIGESSLTGLELVQETPDKVDKTLHFIEEPVEIIDRGVKGLRPSRISIVKVYWNSKRVSVTVSLLWIIDSERDRVIVVDHGTRSVPLFVMLSVTRVKQLLMLIAMLACMIVHWMSAREHLGNMIVRSGLNETIVFFFLHVEELSSGSLGNKALLIKMIKGKKRRV
ncbi:hypothetical protein Tco_0981118 [Tanacetum coccineum]